MRSSKFLILSGLVLSAAVFQGQQKTYDWVPQEPHSYRIGPGYASGVAVYTPRGAEAIHVRLDVEARQPFSVGVVRLEDWNHAVRNPDRLSRLDYACLTEEVTQISYSCNFYADSEARVVVVRDARSTDHPVVTGVAAPFVQNGVNQVFANDIRVTSYRWSCVSHCDQPDPPQFAWVNLSKDKYEITPALKSYGPFTPEDESEPVRIQVKSQTAMTVAVVSRSQAEELSAHPEQAREILERSACRRSGVQSSTLECTLEKIDGAMQVVLLPETETGRKKKAEVTISTVACVENCVK
ncbi:MAG TPA: hypothetical protein VFT65_05295 [Candidatus Angelobacter sp.]|nr:hypothetical protein [Candidatus Angelobacter sp.]